MLQMSRPLLHHLQKSHHLSLGTFFLSIVNSSWDSGLADQGFSNSCIRSLVCNSFRWTFLGKNEAYWLIFTVRSFNGLIYLLRVLERFPNSFLGCKVLFSTGQSSEGKPTCDHTGDLGQEALDCSDWHPLCLMLYSGDNVLNLQENNQRHTLRKDNYWLRKEKYLI